MRFRCLTIVVVALSLASIASAADPKTCKKNCDVPAPIVFFDIAGPDLEKLADFYARNFAWKIDLNNTIDKASTGGIGGSLRKDPPDKIIYIGVPDVTAALQKIAFAGGSIVVPRVEVKGVVILGLFKDPAGNTMGLVETIKGKIKIP
jgi:predicted enzyme related to lactoylglutathione lyase